jgi:hypothetical protein
MKGKAILIITLVGCFAWWTVPAQARLFPPCQDIHWEWAGDLVTLRYWVTDPITGQTQEETYSLEQGAAHAIEWVQADKGILTWIAKYRAFGETDYTYEVHFRLYDPGRGIWKTGVWGPFTGYGAWIDQHQVKDGVVAWTAHKNLGPNPTDPKEHQVNYATYDPELGNFVADTMPWQVGYLDKSSPEVLRVKNGVVSWPMNGAATGVASDMEQIDIYFTIYDQELHGWQPAYVTVHGGSYFFYDLSFDWIEIVDDTAYVNVRFSTKGIVIYSKNNYYMYDPNSHTWDYHSSFNPSLCRRAYCVAAPASGIVPFWVWLWDCSYALDGINNPSSWLWQLTPGDATLTDRTSSFLCDAPGQYTVTEKVFYEAGLTSYSAAGQITAQLPAAPAGGIAINNGATYTTSTNVTLSLGYSSSAKQMCFRQSPGLVTWTAWGPVATSKNWTLSTMRAVGTSPDGPHTVSVKFRDQYNTESLVSTASIILDTTPPAVLLTLNNGAATTTDPNVRVKWSASDAIGITQMSYAALNQGDSKYMWSTPINFNPPVLTYRPATSNIKFNTKPGRKTVMVRFTDVAGNVSQAQTSIQFKPASLPFLLLLLGN